MFKNSVALWNLLGLRRCLQYRPVSSDVARPITWNDVSTALRPFYFIVHPDKFWNHPREKQANEHSLKQLNAYIDALLNQKKTGPLSLNFYVRQSKSAPRQEFRNVQIRLSSQNVRATVHEVLTSCSLATTDLGRLSSATDEQTTGRPPRADDSSNISSFADAVLRRAPRSARDIERDASHGHWTVGGRRVLDFERFLRESGPVARERSAQSAPIREETVRLSRELVTTLQLAGIRWECGWGAGHHRGCLESFRRLVQQHPEAAEALRGRTVVLGRTTGVSLDGYVMLSIEEVRHNWLSLLKALPRGDPYVARVPQAERELSEALRGIRVEHRKFKPSVVAQAYVQQLQKLTLALHRWVQ
ncbi:T-cell activation inhibitor, mitochondrial isoform X2 [Ixodes scapularis]